MIDGNHAHEARLAEDRYPFRPCTGCSRRRRRGEAQKHISHGAWARISGGAADELTLRWNHEAYEKIGLNPRALVDVSKLDTRCGYSETSGDIFTRIILTNPFAPG